MIALRIGGRCVLIRSSAQKVGFMIVRMLLLVHAVAAVAALAALPALTPSLFAEVVRIEVLSRTDMLDGKAFGTVGGYEKLLGTIYFAVDPHNSANQAIVDIDKAPLNADGKVEFSADFHMLRPRDLARGNGVLLHEIVNRGNKMMLQDLNFGSGGFGSANDLNEAADLDDGFLMEQGFTLLWVGWQFNVPMRNDPVRAYLPVARDADGSPIQGLVRSDFVLREKAAEAEIPGRGQTGYPVADPLDASNVLTVRDTVTGERRLIPRAEWEFGADGQSVQMSAGFEPMKIYEVVYISQDPPVAGLGFAAVRDAVSKLKYGSAPEMSIPQGAFDRVIGFGRSMSGRFLRTLLYYGFNEDESHRKVLDGIIAHVGGSSRGGFNHRFAQPGRGSDPFANFFYPVDVFPFTDVSQVDPATGRRDGLLTHASKPEFLPKVMYTNSSHEYWTHVGALHHISVSGDRDAALMPNVRLYLFTGGQHGVGPFPPRVQNGQQLSTPLDYRWASRKLLLSMDRWIAEDVEPPPSAYPRVDNGTLVTPEQLKLPPIPNVGPHPAPHMAYRVDYGPDFLSKGIITQEPPILGSAYPSLVPQADVDGNGLAGVRMPEIAVPLATYMGWNLYNERTGPTHVVAVSNGSFIPFAPTRADRERTGDPRPSVEERYTGRDHYLDLILEAADDLVSEGYLIQDDVPRIVEQAGTRWDYVMSPSAESSESRD